MRKALAGSTAVGTDEQRRRFSTVVLFCVRRRRQTPAAQREQKQRLARGAAQETHCRGEASAEQRKIRCEITTTT